MGAGNFLFLLEKRYSMLWDLDSSAKNPIENGNGTNIRERKPLGLWDLQCASFEWALNLTSGLCTKQVQSTS